MKKYMLIILSIISLLSLGTSEYNYISYTTNIQNENMTLSVKYPNIKELYNSSLVNKNVANLLEKYPDFRNVLSEANIRIPIDGDLIPQGITKVENKIFITYYHENEEDNSICYVLDEAGKVLNKVNLDINSHVGSISYDAINKMFWIPDKDGILNAYDYNSFINKKYVRAKYRFYNVGNNLLHFKDEEKNDIASISIDNNYIYLGSFSIDYKCIIKRYEIVNKKGKITLKYKNTFKVPSQTQGLTFYERNNKKYMILSKSYRRRKPSYIYIYEYDEDIKDYNKKEIIKIQLPPMLEQITIEDGKIYTLFESNARKYRNGIDRVDYICILDFDEILLNKYYVK